MIRFVSSTFSSCCCGVASRRRRRCRRCGGVSLGVGGSSDCTGIVSSVPSSPLRAFLQLSLVQILLLLLLQQLLLPSSPGRLSSNIGLVHAFVIGPSPSSSSSSPSSSFLTSTPPSSPTKTCRRSETTTTTTMTKMTAADQQQEQQQGQQQQRRSSAMTWNEDEYLWLEDVESDESLNFAKRANERCLRALGDPKESPGRTYRRVLEILESDDRIPHVTSHGTDPAAGQTVLFNFWKDSKNPKGLWRRTTMDSYRDAANPTEWTTVLDVDELAERDGISWVWKGSTGLPRSRDPTDGKLVTRALLSLSRGGSDAVHVKEFDLTANEFVPDERHPFHLPEAKSRVSYKSRDVLYVATDFGPGSLTDSGYPRTIREWVRGTRLEDAPTIFEGEAKDVSVFTYVADERIWNGQIYEVRGRSLDFYTKQYWIRPIQYEHLLAPNDPLRQNIPEPPEFVEVDIPKDASIDFVGHLVLISLRSDWQPNPSEDNSGVTYKKGSIITTPANHFFENGASKSQFQILFEPTERTAYEYYAVTKHYFILYSMDTVKAKLDFYKIDTDDEATTLTKIDGAGNEPRIHDYSVRPVDPYEGSDEFWFTSNGFETPSTLYLADASKVEQPQSDNSDSEYEEIFITEKIRSLPNQYDASNIVVEQRFATSLDGTQVPYFIAMPRDIELNGKTPTLLYGYGGFEVSLGPHYVPTQGVAWLERGGAYVEGNIRGGGEFGPAWHQAALRERRHKAYEDFIAIAEHLIETGICRPKSLAIRGGSNGGLLMGNMYTMRPDLFGAIHCAVPLLDMKRYHSLLAGASWMAEYGNPDTDDWDYLQKYSPYHNIDESADYPPILVTTSTRDDRVHPGHARKFVKKLWDTGQGKWPVYYYENIEGGHGGAADAKQQAFMTALAYDFMLATLKKNIEAMD